MWPPAAQQNLAGRRVESHGPNHVTASHWTFYLRSLYIHMSKSILQESFISLAIFQEFPFLGVYFTLTL